MTTTTVDRAEQEVRQRSAGWVEPVGRIGLASQGVLYAVVGLLALQVASGRQDDQADQHGAMAAVADQPFGRALLLVLAVGLAAHCLWRLLLAARGDGGEDDAGSVGKRLGHLGRAVLYGAFTVAAVRILMESGDAGGGGQQQRKATASVLGWPGGRAIVVVAGLVVIGTGLWHCRQLFTQSFEDNIDPARCSRSWRSVVVVLGSVGYTARGIVFAAAGVFLVQAALDDDPNRSGGLDNALKRLADTDYGPLVLRVVAVGLIVFGVFRVVDGLTRKRDSLANA